MKASLIRSLIASALALCLISCGSGNSTPDGTQPPDGNPEQPAIKVGASVGTYNPIDLEVPGTFLSFVFNDETAKGESARFSVTGPSGWNNDETFIFDYPVEASSPDSNYFVYYYMGYNEGTSALSGQYTITVMYKDQTYPFTSMLDVSSTMPLPELPTLGTITSNEVVFSTPPVSGATVYLGHILTADIYVGGTGSYEPNFTISNLDLQPETTYYALAWALNIDLYTIEPEALTNTQVNVSESFVDFTLEQLDNRTSLVSAP